MDEEEPNPLMQDIRHGIKSNSNQQSVEKTKEEMAKIILELKQKMIEIDKITNELEEKRNELDKNSPKKTERILQEIKVPPLELLK
ncbi:MAG: hypothetical protein WC462_02950 [archaeon]